MSTLKRKAFTLEEKAVIIMRLEAGETNISLAKEMGVARSTISTIWKYRATIKTNFENGEKSINMKRMRHCYYEEVDEVLLKWIKSQENRDSISGTVLQVTANQLAREIGIDHFKCSNGWIQRFRKRHGISSGKVSDVAALQDNCDERSKPDEDVCGADESVRECKEKWKNIRTVFRRHLPSKTGVPPKKNYYLHNELQFLIPIISSSSTSKKSVSTSVIDDHSDMEILEVKVEDEEPQEEHDPLENFVSDVDSPQLEVDVRNEFVTNQKRSFEEDTFIAENNCHKAKETKLNASSSAEADEQFLLSLKWDLGEMNSKQKRLFKKGVYDLIDKIMESDNHCS